ncbi:hypothetical protein SERLA73DRAFT_74342 [Serpula lacrymans var. lacrymans S7.3]|uniref:C2H2-type domain-containing protein n=2 Tax=Serpula lacrymans var. lacrymans TaxID=341189 RepID=F8Q1B9_SERL3|nr:uncharacterized protein SERLADRAFT_438991 [Serpula lacrymans var. lacrymans S7.9]EGN98097.1 hypothetical protein SERLA73DRAFT_74342 [Serpula lacrymans var. lacrymans S7.3]EGO23679.1 hypothetical protein SERLADRAFT_438991 [Serpula lacrymans var. lacrymans S7.9]
MSILDLLSTKSIQVHIMSLPIHCAALVNKDASHMCPAECGKSFATAHAVNAHLGSANKCLWYRKGKLQALTIPQSEEDLEKASGLDMLIDDDGEEETTGDVLQELQKDLFSFVPIQPPNIIEDE